MSHDDPQEHVRTIDGREYYSQAGQDLFALEMTNHKRGGYYCEIGGGHPFESNNTFLLEQSYDWKGLSIEFDSDLASRYNRLRSNPCHCSDATRFDYVSFFAQHGFPTQIDYLSLDIDPAPTTYRALEHLPLDQYRFSVITYEHDAYLSGAEFMVKSRELLRERGYQLVVANVKSFGRDFEDWWVDPKTVPETRWRRFCAETTEFSELFK
jgi:hypothetical protein